MAAMHELSALFPKGIATGPAFCNRDHERARLRADLRAGRHTWIWARRRIGKTSLIEQVRDELQRGRPVIRSTLIDLNAAYSDDALVQLILARIADLSLAMLPKRTRNVDALLKAFADLQPEVSLAGSLRLRFGRREAAPTTIIDALLGLDSAAQSLNKRVVICFDEFQQLHALQQRSPTAYALEGAIRHAVERAKQVTYVFSGSERHLLAAMFEHPDRPLFRLCQKMTLARIAAADYRAFLDAACQSRWNKSIDAEVCDQILSLTHRSPLYVNALCNRLWSAKRAPSTGSVEKTWRRVASGDRAIAVEKVRQLSAAQRAVLFGIAHQYPVQQPTSKDFLHPLGLSPSTAHAAIEVLEQADLIRDEDAGWSLVDPVVQHYVLEISAR